MADNYIEKREQEIREARPKAKKAHPSLESLLKRNRSYRGYDASHKVTREDLLKLLDVTRWIGSGMNAQPLRYRLVCGVDAAKVHPLVKLGAALPEEHLPHPGEEPQAYIVICAEAGGRVVDIDLGIASQSILLKAVEAGLGGIFILNFRPADVRAALDLPLEPIGIIGLGKPLESVFIVDAESPEALDYYRKGGAHFVPKLKVEDILI